MKREIGRFLIVGFMNVWVDLAAYSLLLWLHMPIAPAKAASFIAGTLFAYVANRIWTFNTFGHPRRFVAFLALYATSLGVNVTSNEFVLALLGDWDLAIGAAYVVATGSSATLNFLGMKFVVFSPRCN